MISVHLLVKVFLVSVIKETQGVPEAKRRLGTKLRLEGHLQGRGSGDLGDRSEGGSANKGSNSKDGSEHYLFIIVIFVLKYKLMSQLEIHLRDFRHLRRKHHGLNSMYSWIHCYLYYILCKFRSSSSRAHYNREGFFSINFLDE